jgi:hypothetical protein
VAHTEKQSADPHEQVGKTVMYIIAITIAVCSTAVIVFKGVDAMPYDWIGVIGAAVFTLAALAMTRVESH